MTLYNNFELDNLKKYGCVKTIYYSPLLHIIRKNGDDESGVMADISFDTDSKYIIYIDITIKNNDHIVFTIGDTQYILTDGMNILHCEVDNRVKYTILLDCTKLKETERVILKSIKIEKNTNQKTIDNNVDLNKNKNAVLLHMGNLDMWDKMDRYLDQLHDLEYDLWITISNHTNHEGKIDYLIKIIKTKYPESNIMIVPNRGMDLGGFFYALRDIINNGYEYEYLLKLHTKTMDHWRDNLILPLTEKYKTAIELMNNNNNIGMVGSAGCIAHMNGFDKRNRYHLNVLFNRLGFRKMVKWSFVAGTIFWTRFDFFKQIYGSHLDWFINNLNDRTTYDLNWMKYNKVRTIGNLLWDNAHNTNYIRDAMVEHALERILGYAVYYYGFYIHGL